MKKRVLKNRHSESIKGVSPIIATVLLIAIVIVIGLILFLWFREMTEETITKFGGTNVKLVCGDVNFEASYSNGVLSLLNSGNVPIFGIKVKLFKEGSHETKDLRDLSENWPDLGLNQGGTFSGEISLEEEVNKIILIPVLIGNSEKGEKTFVCEEQYGFEIII